MGSINNWFYYYDYIILGQIHKKGSKGGLLKMTLSEDIVLIQDMLELAQQMAKRNNLALLGKVSLLQGDKIVHKYHLKED